MTLDQISLEGYDLLPPARQTLAVQGLHSAMSTTGRSEPDSYRLAKHIRRMFPSYLIPRIKGEDGHEESYVRL